MNGPMSSEERARLVIALDHDVRQPQHSIEMGLRTLRLLLSDLKARRFDDASLDALLQKMAIELSSIQAASRQVLDTQQDLFDAIRLESEATSPQSKTLHASDLVGRVVASTRGLASNVEVRGYGSRLTFVSDERWVERILSNLVGNAISHSRGTRISVGARRDGSGIAFEVRDNGRGMESEEVARVFSPTRPAALSPIGSSAARSGLGLYNVGLFVRKLGGSVQCRSMPKRGTLFRVVLPGPINYSTPASSLSDSHATQPSLNKLVTLLDDDLTVLRATERALERLGVEVYADHDPIRWLSVVTDINRMPDLVLLDFRIGKQSANLFLEILRKKWAGRVLRVIVLTSQRCHPSVRQLAKVAPVLEKPLSDVKLKLIVDLLAMRASLPDKGFL